MSGNSIKSSIRNFVSKSYKYSKIYSEAILLNHYLDHNNISIVLDVGANTGQYALSLRRFGYKKKIISFEPQLKEYKKILKNSSDDNNWFIHERIALGEKKRIKKIYNSKNSVSSSLKKINPIHTRADPKSKIVSTEIVKVKKLDDIFKNYHKRNKNILLKIDTQGYEYEVLKGSIKSLKHINLIQIELSLVNLYKNQVNWLKVLNFLEKKNFRVIKFFDGFKNKKNNEFLQIDCLLKKFTNK